MLIKKRKIKKLKKRVGSDVCMNTTPELEMEKEIKELREENEVLKKELLKKEKKYPNTRASFIESMTKQVDGKTFIAIAIYLIFKYWAATYPGIISEFWKNIVEIGIWVICVMFNIDNPSLATFARQLGEMLLDDSQSDADTIFNIKTWLSALNQKFMRVFRKGTVEIKDGVLKVLKVPKEVVAPDPIT